MVTMITAISLILALAACVVTLLVLMADLWRLQEKYDEEKSLRERYQAFVDKWVEGDT